MSGSGIHGFRVTHEFATSWPNIIEKLAGLKLRTRKSMLVGAEDCICGTVTKGIARVNVVIGPMPRVVKKDSNSELLLMRVTNVDFGQALVLQAMNWQKK